MDYQDLLLDHLSLTNSVHIIPLKINCSTASNQEEEHKGPCKCPAQGWDPNLELPSDKDQALSKCLLSFEANPPLGKRSLGLITAKTTEALPARPEGVLRRDSALLTKQQCQGVGRVLGSGWIKSPNPQLRNVIDVARSSHLKAGICQTEGCLSHFN